jgi:hypothetical protein
MGSGRWGPVAHKTNENVDGLTIKACNGSTCVLKVLLWPIAPSEAVPFLDLRPYCSPRPAQLARICTAIVQ